MFFCVVGHLGQEANVVVAVGSNDEVGDRTLKLKETVLDLKPEGCEALCLMTMGRSAIQKTSFVDRGW